MTAKKLFCQTKEKQNDDEENRCDSEHSIYSFKSNNVRVGKGYSECGDFWQARLSHSVIEPSVSWKPRTRELWERRKSIYCAPVRSENARLASAIRSMRDLANTEGYDGTHVVPLLSIVKNSSSWLAFLNTGRRCSKDVSPTTQYFAMCNSDGFLVKKEQENVLPNKMFTLPRGKGEVTATPVCSHYSLKNGLRIQSNPAPDGERTPLHFL